jgi:conjugative transfer signal peptidase TraF
MILACLSAAAVALGGPWLAPHLRWNLTASVPRGLYYGTALEGSPSRGELVAFPVPEAVAPVVFGRGLLPRGAYLIKYVAGVPGDWVCLDAGRYEVNGELVGEVRALDSAGLPLPSFSFCGAVAPGHYFVATEASNSFDSRYFGPLPASALREKLRPLWTF